jgi:hypothetical protein
VGGLESMLGLVGMSKRSSNDHPTTACIPIAVVRSESMSDNVHSWLFSFARMHDASISGQKLGNAQMSRREYSDVISSIFCL